MQKHPSGRPMLQTRPIPCFLFTEKTYEQHRVYRRRNCDSPRHFVVFWVSLVASSRLALHIRLDGACCVLPSANTPIRASETLASQSVRRRNRLAKLKGRRELMRALARPQCRAQKQKTKNALITQRLRVISGGWESPAPILLLIDYGPISSTAGLN